MCFFFARQPPKDELRERPTYSNGPKRADEWNDPWMRKKQDDLKGKRDVGGQPKAEKPKKRTGSESSGSSRSSSSSSSSGSSRRYQNYSVFPIACHFFPPCFSFLSINLVLDGF